MQTQTIRTTVDLEKNLARQLKQYAGLQGFTQKQIIQNALVKYLNNQAKRQSASKLWQEMRSLAKTGKKRADLVTELRKDRNR